jgi:hypothetical protein
METGAEAGPTGGPGALVLRPQGMLSVALPPELVATGAMVTGALAALLLLVPQIWAVPAARLTSWIE